MQQPKIAILVIGGLVVVVVLALVASPMSLPTNISAACPMRVDNKSDCKDLGRGITLSLSVDKSFYKAGENVKIEWTVTNNNPTNVTLMIPLPEMVNLRIYNETEMLVWAQPRYLFLDLEGIMREGPGRPIRKEMHFRQRESYANNLMWDMTKVECKRSSGSDLSGRCNWQNSGMVPPGEYTVRLSNVPITYGKESRNIGIPDSPSEFLSLKFEVEAVDRPPVPIANRPPNQAGERIAQQEIQYQYPLVSAHLRVTARISSECCVNVTGQMLDSMPSLRELMLRVDEKCRENLPPDLVARCQLYERVPIDAEEKNALKAVLKAKLEGWGSSTNETAAKSYVSYIIYGSKEYTVNIETVWAKSPDLSFRGPFSGARIEVFTDAYDSKNELLPAVIVRTSSCCISTHYLRSSSENVTLTFEMLSRSSKLTSALTEAKRHYQEWVDAGHQTMDPQCVGPPVSRPPCKMLPKDLKHSILDLTREEFNVLMDLLKNKDLGVRGPSFSSVSTITHDGIRFWIQVDAMWEDKDPV